MFAYARGVKIYNMELLFVYGTLKKGFYNHFYLEKSKYLGRAKTLNKYALYLKGFIPFVTKSPKVCQIKGELYLVDDKTLSEVDLLEGHPDEYFREKVPIVKEDGEVVEAWMYFYPQTKEPGILISTGEYTHKLLKH